MSAPTRRQILMFALPAGFAAAGLATGLARGSRLLSASADPSTGAPAPITLPPTLATLSLAEYVTLAAACERIFPRDETPGAIDLGVPLYVDRALAAKPRPGWSTGFRTGLARLDAAARDHFGAAFHRARIEDQQSLLSAWQEDDEDDNATVFRNLVVATLEGAFGDPTYGGNPERSTWTTFGIEVDPFVPSLSPANAAGPVKR